MKVCSRCGFEGEDSLFKKNRNTCKQCVHIESKKYRKNNKEKVSSRYRTYCQNNKEKINSRKREYNKKNKENINAAAKQYRKNNKDRIDLYFKHYRQHHKKKRTDYNNLYQKKRSAYDPAYKLRRMISIAVAQAIKKNGKSILNYLPYSIEELKIHIEKQFDSQMNWGNHGTYWHIDHIIPQSVLPYTSMEDENFKKCWALDNLRPLEAIANMKKGAKVLP